MRRVYSDNLKGSTVYTAYIPHGVSEKYRPLRSNEEIAQVAEGKKKMGLDKFDFILFYNNRNVRRKMPGDVILAYKTFCDMISKEEANRCLLLMHTDVVDGNGTDLGEVHSKICPEYNVKFSTQKLSTEDLNFLYNMVDVTVNIASNEGFGLATCESLRAGTPILVNVTGGLQDQCGFTVNGKLLSAEDYIKIGSLHDKNNLPDGLEWGSWVKPVWPSNRSLQGSPPTPYIFDDRCAYEDVADAMFEWWKAGPTVRAEAGMDGHRFITGGDSKMTAKEMGKGFIDAIEATLENWKPKEDVDIWKI